MKSVILPFLSSFVILFLLVSCDSEPICEAQFWYADIDQDGFGDPLVSRSECEKPEGLWVDNNNDDDDRPTSLYLGSASATIGFGTMGGANLYLDGAREAFLGSIIGDDGTSWAIPADVNYTSNAFPFARELYNPDGEQYGNSSEAFTAFGDSNIVVVDSLGDVYTGYLLADNYFELYINGVPIGKDTIPYTNLNSHIVRFRAERPFTIAALAVDWEENLGIGTEALGFEPNHVGTGGFIAVFKDDLGTTVATTGSDWKAQTFYTAPILDPTCPTEGLELRNSSNCPLAPIDTDEWIYGLHWEIPEMWTSEDFEDDGWPNAFVFENDTIGISSDPSYANFTDIFDDTNADARFIWSSNHALDNEVLLRHTVQ